MKKYLSTAVILSLCLNINAQILFDAMRFSNNSINGSARYMGMAGSFGAIGGDVSASVDNPATLGIFRSSEASVSIGISPTVTKSDWQGNRTSEGTTPFNVNNLAWVINLPSYRESGYLNTNLSFSYHNVKNFNRRIFAQGTPGGLPSLTDLMAGFLNRDEENLIYEDDIQYDNSQIGWLSILGYDAYLINPVYDENEEHTGKWTSILGLNGQILPTYDAIESGDINDYNFTYSGNVNDMFYFGAGVSMQNISYEIKSVYSEDYVANGDYFDLTNIFATKGFGVNLKLGAIVRATNFMRFGLSFQTPTWYSLKDYQYAELFYNDLTNQNTASTPEAEFLYTFRTPLKTQASIGFIIGKRAAVNVDYQFSGKKYSASDDLGKFIIDENREAKYVHAVKIGAEVRLGDNFKIRGGGAFFSAPISQNAVKLLPYNTTRTDFEYFVSKNTYYGTFGLGYAKNSISIDLAYAYQHQNQNFFAAENFEYAAASLKTHRHNIIATLAVRY